MGVPVSKPKWAGRRISSGWQWTGREYKFIKQHAGKKSTEWIACELGRTFDSVVSQVSAVVKISLKTNFVCPCGRSVKRQVSTQTKCAECQGEYEICLSSVRRHYRSIFNETDAKYGNYVGMPFFDGWNPGKGGSFRAGADWIIANLGKRPKGSTLHIINHEKGFVPGNLEWTHPRKQSNQQMFKIIAQQRHRIKELEAEVALLKAA